MDSMESIDSMESMDSMEPMDSMDSMDSMESMGTHFPQKNRPEYCFLQYIGALPEFIHGFTGSSGNGVSNRRSDPPFHAQES